MTVDGQSDETIRHLLTTTLRIALVGASMKPWRASHGVMRFLLDHGFDVTPVNPMLAGQTYTGGPWSRVWRTRRRWTWWTCFATPATSAPWSTRPFASAHGASGCNWASWTRMRRSAPRAAGITVVMDRCPVIEDRRLHLFAH